MKNPYRMLIAVCAAVTLFIGLSMIGKDHAASARNVRTSLASKQSNAEARKGRDPSAPAQGMGAKPTLPPTPIETSMTHRSGNGSAASGDPDEKEPTVISDYQAWTATAGKIIPVDSETYALRGGFAIAHKNGEWITGDTADLRFDKANSSVEVDIPGQTQIDRGSVTMEGDGVNILEQNLENGGTVRTTLFAREVVVRTEQGKQVWPAGTMITEDADGRILMIASNATSHALVDESFAFPRD